MIKLRPVNLLNPNIEIEVLMYCPYSSGGVGGDVLKYQLDSSFLIMYSILKTTLFSKALIL